jgi:hypothetical protein
MQDEELFINSIYRGDIKEILRIIKTTGILPHKIRNARGYSAFHIAALNSNYSVAEFLINYIERTYPKESQEILKE